MSSRRLLSLLLATLALLAIAGCAHYRLGTGAEPSFSTLYIEPIENRAVLPQARALLDTHLRDAFERDGRVTLAGSPETADVTLRVVIQNFDRDVASVRESDTRLARKFTLTLATSCTLHDRRTGETLFSHRVVRTQRDAMTDGGQLQSEYQTVPLLAESLARKITHAVLDVW
jgi:hypothetical protein